ncbi:MAG: class I tRNA ligase family protein, partial [Pseudomonadota bacterium]
MMPFTMEETFQSRQGNDLTSIHMEQFPEVPAQWKNDELLVKWKKIRAVRKVVTGALEVERREKRIGSSLEAAPTVHVTDATLMAAIEGQDMAEICITSSISITDHDMPVGIFVLDDVSGVGVVPTLAEGEKCARSWKVLPDIGSDPDYPDISARDAAAMREIEGCN